MVNDEDYGYDTVLHDKLQTNLPGGCGDWVLCHWKLHGRDKLLVITSASQLFPYSQPPSNFQGTYHDIHVVPGTSIFGYDLSVIFLEGSIQDPQLERTESFIFGGMEIP